MGTLRFGVLGPLVAERDGEPIALGGPQTRAVLALLLLEAGRVVSADRLIADLWPGDPPATARVALQGHISALRRALGGGNAGAISTSTGTGTGSTPATSTATNSPIVTQAPGYRLRLEPGALDLDTFQAEVAAARAEVAAGNLQTGAAGFRAALARWRGRAYADVELPVVREAARRVDEWRLVAFEEAVDAELALGRARELAVELAGVVAEHPLHERFRGQLMIALARSGRIGEAIEEYARARRLLIDELGLEPSAPLRAVHAGILRAEPGFTPDAGPPHRPAAAVPRMLPADLNDFTGRAAQLGRLCEVLAAPARDAPAVAAITGPGGAGKTTLMVHAAHRVAERYPDGQLFVRLHGASSDPLCASTALARLLRGLGIAEQVMPAHQDDRAGLYRSLLAGRRMLVTLDDARDEEQVRPLLPAAPGCAVLVTSRQRLAGLEGLHAVPVDVFSTDDAVTLLDRIAGGGRVAAEPRVAAELVGHCGELPLAVRIAGSRLASRPQWTLSDLARHLVVERERLDWLEIGDLGIRASLALSYRQLDDNQQRLFRRLGLLAAPDFASWVAAAVLDTRSGTAERLLEDLVDRHLVDPAGRGVTCPRYRLHDLLRLLARELAEAEDSGAERDAARDRALAGWLALAGRADDALLRYPLDPYPRPCWQPAAEVLDAAHAEPAGWFADEQSALLVAVRQAADADRADLAWPLAMRLSSSLANGEAEPWRRVLDQARAAAVRVGDRLGEAAMLRLLAEVELSWDDFPAARATIAQARRAYDAVDPDRGEAQLCSRLGLARMKEADPAGAMVDYRRALAAAQRLGDRTLTARARYGIFSIRFSGKDLASSFDEYELLLADLRSEGGTQYGLALHNYGIALRKAGRYAASERRFIEALHELCRLGDQRRAALTRASLARLYTETGRVEDAAPLAEQALTWCRELGEPYSIGRALYVAGMVAQASGDLDGAADRYREALAIWRELGYPYYLRQTLTALAGTSAAVGDREASEVYEAELRELPPIQDAGG